MIGVEVRKPELDYYDENDPCERSLANADDQGGPAHSIDTAFVYRRSICISPLLSVLRHPLTTARTWEVFSTEKWHLSLAPSSQLYYA
jgi:hypothetical protein